MSDLLRDPSRLRALSHSGLMDSGPEEGLDRLTRLASRLLDAPVALISLVDDERQYFKSAVGMEIDGTPLSHSFCQYVVADQAPLVVSDARRHPVLHDSPAIDELGVIAYCGVPLTDADGHTLGSFCAVAESPREWTEAEVEVLTELASNVITALELRAANRALHAKEQEARGIIDGAHDAFVASDLDGRILDWNPAAERLFGWRAEDVIGEPLAGTILPDGAFDDPALGLPRYLKALDEGESPEPLAVKGRHRDGRELLVEVTIAAVDAPQGRRFNTLIRDIGERRAAEHHRAQLAQVVESTRDAVTTIDCEGRITSWNKGAERLYGFTAEEMIGRVPADRVRFGARCEQRDDLMPRLLEGRHVHERALPRRHRDGHVIYVDLSAAPLLDDRGQVVGATSIARDVTEQHRLELELAESESRFRQTFDEGPVGVAVVGPNGRWLEVNRAVCEIVGYSESELLQLSFQDITHPDDLDADVGQLTQLLAGEIATYQMEKRYFHKRGHTIWVKLSVGMVRDEGGTPLYCVAHIEDITRAKAAESALREGRRLLDESQSVAGVGSWSWNLETGEIAWSVQQYLLHGVSPLDPVPSLDRFRLLIHPDDREELTAAMAGHAARRMPFLDEYRVVLPGGRVRTISVRGDFLDADPASGLPARIAGTTHDVSTERAVRQAQQEIENRQRVLLSSLPDTVIVLYDRELRCALAQGGGIADESGLRVVDYEGKHLSEFIPAQSIAELERQLLRALDGESATFEYPTQGGRTFNVDVVPYRPDGETITGAFTVWRDVTERLMGERQTRMLATIVEQSEDAIIAKSREGIITEWNRAAEALYGYTAAEAIGRSVAMLVPAERAGEDRMLLGRALAGEAVPQFETVRVRKDGSRVPVSISVSPLHDRDDTIIGASIVARDTTERRHMEDELRASREQALEASRLKSEFVANMSHEIRTPLNGVVSMAELLLDTPLNAEQSEYAQVALTSAEALMRVINEILDFSKIEAGKLEVVNEDYSLRSAVEDCVEIVGVKGADRDLKLTVAFGDSVAEVVRGDDNRVRQVLTNLLGNAVKFTAAGEVAVTVERLDSQRLRVAVRDTGIGIDPDRVGDLFQPFSQADATTTRRYGGTGLGLCISRQLVELMGGEIGCDSRIGEGSTFWFTLPYEPGAKVAPRNVRTDLTGTRVLVVDGVAAELRQMESRLAGWGISPDGAANGVDALRILRRAAEVGRPYEAAVIERELLGIDGIELARRIKQVPALRATRLILVTGRLVEPAEIEAAGIEAQLVKPVRQSRLYNQLLASLHKTGSALALSAQAPEAPAGGASPRGRVLVAEDNQVNQFAAIRLLQTFGFSVDVASNGREAVELTERHEYAAVFMDCQMPEMDGYTATRVIRERERGRRTTIIALTANALDGDKDQCLAAGMDDYMTKPLRLQSIEAVIARVPALGGADSQSLAAHAEPAAPAVFDPSALAEIGDPAVEAELAQMFLDQATANLPELGEAIAAGDADRVHRLAHTLKGSSATSGALWISELSRDLCELATGELTPRAGEIHIALARALEETGAALAAHVAKLRSVA